MKTASPTPNPSARPVSGRTSDLGDRALVRGDPGHSTPSTAIVVAASHVSARRARGATLTAPTVTRVPMARQEHYAAWTSIDRAAAFLGVPVVTLRRAIERVARRQADGSVIAQVDGVVARKLGRVWRVWLDAAWRNPSAAVANGSST